jgi:hypothetical protein
MKKMIFITLLILSAPLVSSASTNDTVIFTPLGHFYYTSFPLWSAYSPLIDRAGRPYVYTASIDLGMVTFDISNQMNPVPVDTITPAMLNNTKATFLAQNGTSLYISSGGFQSAGERAGLSIYNMSNPLSPVLLDRWDTAAFTHGTAQVVLEGNYAYLAAMDDGVIILNITNPNNIQFVSQFIPSNISCINANHTRGLFIRNDTLLVANDCGGLRIIDVTNKSAPVEIGAYQNTNYGGYPYYNHVWRLGDYAYIPVDYCGFEVDNISNPSNISNASIWDPWNCTGLSSWNGSDGHTNEIVSALPTANILMVSGGDSQVLAFDPSNPAQPRLMGVWGVPNSDSLGAWGIDVFGNLAVVGYIHTPFPFSSDKGGIQLLSWNLVLGENELAPNKNELAVFPNPATDKCFIRFTLEMAGENRLQIVDVYSKVVVDRPANSPSMEIDISSFSAGVYFIQLNDGQQLYTAKLIVGSLK